jgi:cytochrome c1
VRSLAIAAIALLVVVGVTAASVPVWQTQQQSRQIARALTGGDPAAAPALLRRYGCAGCHTIPDIPGGDGQVGGSLADIKRRVYIGGVTTNTPDNLVRWIVSPQTYSPRTAMPVTGISEADARHVAAYLYSH